MIPLSLYIHIPWCIKKCPYCDFNSHAIKDDIPEDAYVQRLIEDLHHDLPYVQGRKLHSIFIGGGTPSLFSASAYEKLFAAIFHVIERENTLEITLEANPGTVEQQRFKDYYKTGINRLSIGCQSFNATHLKSLGRIHDTHQAIRAAENAINAGFTNFNLDLMFGLPQQSIHEALDDLRIAVDLHTSHLSWYQLTLEPNTVFYKYPPALPQDDLIAQMHTEGLDFLKDSGFNHYEVSAFSKDNQQCKHNLNYWRFGDYLGIGAGAHGKITNLSTGSIIRLLKHKHPKNYLACDLPLLQKQSIHIKDRPFEFLLNALRLYEPISFELMVQRTGLDKTAIKKQLQSASDKGLIVLKHDSFHPTQLGYRFLNDLLGMFL